ncbi:MAG: ABC transporter ATP-binding protein [Chloroflexi bacterium]|nr:ABC transporter ATP-binding protein [Chloroflexota bacterium]
MPLLETDRVCRYFGGLKAVHEISLKVEPGEILGIIGPNGAGKTTLFNVLSGYYRPTSGTVSYEGRRISGLKPHQICKLGVARTFQLVKPFPKLTVLDNVVVGALNRTSSDRVAEAAAADVLELTGLSAKRNSLGSSLPIADRKRLEVARALATQPRLLLLDEVMAGLTATEIAEAVELVRRVRESGITIVLIEHVMAAVMALSDRIVVMHHGELIAQGSSSEVARNPAVIEAYLGKGYRVA